MCVIVDYESPTIYISHAGCINMGRKQSTLESFFFYAQALGELLITDIECFRQVCDTGHFNRLEASDTKTNMTESSLQPSYSLSRYGFSGQDTYGLLDDIDHQPLVSEDHSFYQFPRYHSSKDN